MIPSLITLPGSPWPVLPPGIHQASLDEVSATYATNLWRRELFDGLADGAARLRVAGCPKLYLDGSYVTGKPKPGDFDACWEPNGVDPEKLDQIFLQFEDFRRAQKTVFKGEFFPSSYKADGPGRTFLDFFQVDKSTGEKKGIIAIPLSADPLLLRKVQP
ncbi:MAG: hypothetical protein K2X66_12545 [Cyanobacteria bacterium]|nr:hypothetical protein [Cyanobacteriota bacterium]